VLLDGAREKAREYRLHVENGTDPADERRKLKAALIAAKAKAITFNDAAKAVLQIKQQEFRNPKHTAQWETTLARFASPILGTLAVSDIEVEHVLQVLQPIWKAKTETAVRLRGRIETIFDWCQARGYRKGENPARWDGHLKELLPQPSKIRKVKNFRSLPYRELPAFITQLRQQQGVTPQALLFTILTAARSGEIRGARWSEMDLKEQVWTVPPERMKAGREHRVPLSQQAIMLLESLSRFTETDLVFPSLRKMDKLTDTALLVVLRRMKIDVVPHGFRATFKTWASEETAFPKDVIEAALAHSLENKTEAAYQRGDLLEKRRNLMQSWAAFCHSHKGLTDGTTA
jgi:integrase